MSMMSTTYRVDVSVDESGRITVPLPNGGYYLIGYVILTPGCTAAQQQASVLAAADLLATAEEAVRQWEGSAHPFDAPDADDLDATATAMRRVAHLETLPFAGLSRESSSDPQQVERRMLVNLLAEMSDR